MSQTSQEISAVLFLGMEVRNKVESHEEFEIEDAAFAELYNDWHHLLIKIKLSRLDRKKMKPVHIFHIEDIIGTAANFVF
jgi:hypothetical protein